MDNRAFLAIGRLKMPVLAIGGEKSLGATMAIVMRSAADDVREIIIRDSGPCRRAFATFSPRRTLTS
jgi:hypothetical protein